MQADDNSANPDGQKIPDASLLDTFVGYNLRRAAAKQRERFRSVFEAYDIRPVQLTALTLLLENRPLRQSALGKALEIKRANVVTLLDQLENRGLIARQSAANNRRSHVVHLTESGKSLTTKLLSLHAKLEQDLAKALGKAELTTLVELLRAFRSVESKPKIR
jgi:DNA-binding MarR family transcriptional regulator